jgi:hypothetical protein
MARKINKRTNFRFGRGEEVVHELDLWIISPCAIISHSYHITNLGWQKAQSKSLSSLSLSLGYVKL